MPSFMKISVLTPSCMSELPNRTLVNRNWLVTDINFCSTLRYVTEEKNGAGPCYNYSN